MIVYTLMLVFNTKHKHPVFGFWESPFEIQKLGGGCFGD